MTISQFVYNYGMTDLTTKPSLTRYAWLSMAAALGTMALKSAAYYFTGSVGLLSDAIESLVNLAGAIMALSMLRIAEQPPDEDHSYGHSKAEYFSSGVEGSLIFIAALSIGYTSVERLFNPKPLEQLGLGLGISVIASIVNLVVSIILLKAAKKNSSITLEANAHHLLTDVWTSVGVLVGVGMVGLTGWLWLDPAVAILVACNIAWVGGRIVIESIHGLMDRALPVGEMETIKKILSSHMKDGIEHHALRTRRSGGRRFVSLHILVPGQWTVKQAHDMVEAIEEEICAELPNMNVTIHFEPIEDPSSWNDVGLDRVMNGHGCVQRKKEK